MPRSEVHSMTGRILAVLFTLLVLAPALGLAPVATAADHQYTAGNPTGNAYEDEVNGAGTAEGDVWGGEQGTTPGSGGGYVADEPVSAGHRDAGWWVRFALYLEWLQTSLWFSDQE